MKKIDMVLSSSYSIYMGENLLHSNCLMDYCVSLNKRLVIITDSHLVDIYATPLKNFLQNNQLSADLLFFPGGEAYKTRETKQYLEDELFALKCGRDTCLLALGGGIVSDLVGFVGATFCRGIPVIYLPTTLLAMVDASIGGKTGVNTPQGKNLIGTFTQPRAVFADIKTLNTLPIQEWHNGIAEMIKHAIIADRALFNILVAHANTLKTDRIFLMEMIHRSCLIKKNIVQQDETDQNIRHILNFGHTIGHAIESVTQFQISHGIAVAIGMVIESYLSFKIGMLSENDVKAIVDILKLYQIPLSIPVSLDREKLLHQLTLDKKSVKNIPRFVLLDEIGCACPQLGNLEPALLHQALEWYLGVEIQI